MNYVQIKEVERYLQNTKSSIPVSKTGNLPVNVEPDKIEVIIDVLLELLKIFTDMFVVNGEVRNPNFFIRAFKWIRFGRLAYTVVRQLIGNLTKK